MSGSGAGTYGQLIPAIPLEAAASTSADVATYAIPGLEISPSSRTNLGLVNPAGSDATITVTALGAAQGSVLGSFDVALSSMQFTQIGDLSQRIPALAGGAHFTLVLTSSAGRLVAYASSVDQISNDPVYQAAVPLQDTTAPVLKVQRVPVAHFQSWRSDVVVFNPSSMEMAVDLTYFDGSGTKRAEAKNLVVGASSFVRMADVLRNAALTPSMNVDSIGTLEIRATTDGVDRYPVVFSRTYNEQGVAGTYGQGIPGIAVAAPNVRSGEPAVIPAVRADAGYYTNVGLVNTSATPARVRVTLLSADDGTPVATWERTDPAGMPLPLQPNESTIVTDVFKAMQTSAVTGSLKIELLSGDGVWAYASVIDRITHDPGYVPAIPLH